MKKISEAVDEFETLLHKAESGIERGETDVHCLIANGKNFVKRLRDGICEIETKLKQETE